MSGFMVFVVPFLACFDFSSGFESIRSLVVIEEAVFLEVVNVKVVVFSVAVVTVAVLEVVVVKVALVLEA